MMKKAIAPAVVAGFSIAAATGAFAQATQDVNITASVPKYCTIAGVTNPAAATRDITVSGTGTVTTTLAPVVQNSVTCNTATNVVATSTGGGVKTPTAAPTGFTNIIDYTGVATFGTATSTINTSTVGTASGAETGNTGTTTGATTGSLTISITPAQPGSPLIAATDYQDTLRVTLTPQ